MTLGTSSEVLLEGAMQVQTRQFDLFQAALEPAGLRMSPDESGGLLFRVLSGSRALKGINARRERSWLLVEHLVPPSTAPPAALTGQSSLVLGKYALAAPAGRLSLRVDLPLAPAVCGSTDRLRELLRAALSPAEAASADPSAVGVALSIARGALADEGVVTPTESGLDLALPLRKGRRRVVSVSASDRGVAFRLPLGPQSELPDADLPVIASALLGLNDAIYFARAGWCGDRAVAEVVLPPQGLTATECRLAVGSLAAVAARDRALEALLVDAHARALFAAHHGIELPGSQPYSSAVAQRGGGPRSAT